MNGVEAAVRAAWRDLAPSASWRGMDTGWHALDLLALAEVFHSLRPAVTILAGGIGAGGLPLFVADAVDRNRRGRLLAGEKMGRERYARLPEHRRIQWVPIDLLVEDFRTAQRLAERASPVLVVAAPASSLDLEWEQLATLVTPGSYLVVASVVMPDVPDLFVEDPSRDPAGLSACSWLLRLPS